METFSITTFSYFCIPGFVTRMLLWKHFSTQFHKNNTIKQNKRDSGILIRGARQICTCIIKPVRFIPQNSALSLQTTENFNSRFFFSKKSSPESFKASSCRNAGIWRREGHDHLRSATDQKQVKRFLLKLSEKFNRNVSSLERLNGAPLSELPGITTTTKLSDMDKYEKWTSIWEALFFSQFIFRHNYWKLILMIEGNNLGLKNKLPKVLTSS